MKEVGKLVVAQPLPMVAFNLQRRYCSFSSHSFSSHLRNPHIFVSPKPPQTPNKLFTSTSYPLLKINNFIHPSYFASATLHPDSDLENHGKRLDEAREAITEYLEQLGASREDASHISFNCPNYLDMLIDGVDDLDDWNSWTASSDRELKGDALVFKKKVYQMAQQKGDDGIIPLLESLGLSLSSASHLARYLSSSGSNSFPLLIHKVKYIKEIVFSGSSDNQLVGKNARRMMAHLSISADEDVQLTLAFFEKIQARRGGLSLLGSESSFRHLIESFPRLLFPPIQRRIEPIVKFLENIGVPKGCIGNIILLFPPILSYDIEKDIKPRLQLFEKIGADDNDLGKMIIKYPWILSASILDNFKKVLEFFDEEKVPKICSSHAIKRWPHILGCSVNKLRVMVEQFGEMGIVNEKLGQVIATSPQLLLRKPQEVVQVVSFLKDLGLDDEAIAKTLGRCPEVFAANINRTLRKKLEFLSGIGISKTHLPRVIRKYPELFVCDVDRALRPRVAYLMKSGLARKDIRSMVTRFSPLLGYNVEEVLKPKLEFLVRIMGRPVSDVVDYPRYLSYSMEKKIKPRYWILKGRNVEFTLEEMLGKNDREFAEAYLGVPPS